MKLITANDRDFTDGPIEFYNGYLYADSEAELNELFDAIVGQGLAENGGIREEHGEGFVDLITIDEGEYRYKADWHKAVRRGIREHKAAKKAAA